MISFPLAVFTGIILLSSSTALSGGEEYSFCKREENNQAKDKEDSGYGFVLRTAVKKASSGYFFEAKKMFKELLRENPDSLNVRQSLQIIEDFEKKKISKEFAQKVFKGIYFILNQDYEAAIEAYKEALDIDPEKSELYYNLGSAYQFLGRYRESIPYFEKVLDSNSGDSDCLFHIGLAYYSEKEYEKAIPYLEDLINRVPHNPEIYTLLGLSYYSLKRHEEAQTAIKKALAIYKKTGQEQEYKETKELLDNLP
ncbi:MAG: tetratricopeptide repeat protein [Candidatus Omnitrophica bacterium]|nr:tetratricopeptide repeat protein [Candidatus Omnitrophota bacterium]MBD3269442.1 tetratricopeptide repeat protein [Candidatus Omnitrophota bacterium]